MLFTIHSFGANYAHMIEKPKYNLKYRIKEIREEKGLTQRDLADLIGHEDHTRILRWENNRTQAPHDELIKIANALDKAPLELYEVPTVPLVGRVGAGGHISTEVTDHDYEAFVEGIPGLPTKTVAVQVDGDSMYPRYFDKEVIFYCRKVPPSELINNKDCIVQLADGRCMVKMIKRGSEQGRFNLESWNAPTIENVEVLWAAEIIGRK